MEVDAPSAGPAASARALALSLYDASEALQAAQDAARELLATQPLPPLDVDTETILAYARLVSRVRPSYARRTGRALHAICDRIAAACAPHGASQGCAQGLAFVAYLLTRFCVRRRRTRPSAGPTTTRAWRRGGTRRRCTRSCCLPCPRRRSCRRRCCTRSRRCRRARRRGPQSPTRWRARRRRRRRRQLTWQRCCAHGSPETRCQRGCRPCRPGGSPGTRCPSRQDARRSRRCVYTPLQLAQAV